MICAAVLGGLIAGEARAVVVTKADDVCAPAADPCIITSEMDIPNGICTNDADQPCSSNTDCADPGFCNLGAVVLDFGVRDLELSGGGRFDFGSSSGKILCGGLTATNSGATIDANQIVPGGFASGTVVVRARRTCSEGGAYPCVFDSDCQLDQCGARRCSVDPSRTCLGDPDCAIGPCVQNGPDRACALAENTPCLTNADCELGTCPGQTTCEGSAGGVLNCSTDDDCNLGSCSVGTAPILVGGTIPGFSQSPATIVLHASDDIVTERAIHIDGTIAESDGGKLDFQSAFGSITINGDVDASSGGLGHGGEVRLQAGTDVRVADILNVTGGGLGGGSVFIDAGRDVVIERSLLANASTGAGHGGEFLVEAGRDLTVVGPSPADRTLLTTRGHASVSDGAGDGGLQQLTAGRDLAVGVDSRMVSNGASPDGFGGEIYLTAAGDLAIDGDIFAKCDGSQGGGGALEGSSGGNLVVSGTSAIDVRGGSEDGGRIVLWASGTVDFAGTADLGHGKAGDGSYGVVRSDADVTISGDMKMNGGELGSFEIEACRITLTGSGELDAGPSSSTNVLTAHESMALQGGSELRTGASGANHLIYRTATKPPILDGTVSPAAIHTVDPGLSPCPVCGNEELDGGETCDDGNTTDGDGCNGDCQSEGCVAQTAPEVECDTNADCGPAQTCSTESGFCTPWELCEDGDPCTTDSCNAAVGGGTCEHALRDCSDGFDCTADSCDSLSGECAYVADDGACDDGNPCTDDVCTLNAGCAGVANSDPCDDGDACTENDTCSASECGGTPIEGCSVCGDGFVEALEQCDDGNATFTEGEYCGVDCVLIACGKPTDSEGVLPKASDAQYTLRAAVGQVGCCLRVCDVDDTGTVLASDAQRVLRKAVGQEVALNCPVTGECPP